MYRGARIRLRALGALSCLVLASMLSFAVTAQAAPDGCAPGEAPAFVAGFAALQTQLGDTMGDPVSCEYPDPSGSGDIHQRTSTGLAFWRKSTNTPTFTDGYRHWAATTDGWVTWTGTSIDPPFPPFEGAWSRRDALLLVSGDGSAVLSWQTTLCDIDSTPPCDQVLPDGRRAWAGHADLALTDSSSVSIAPDGTTTPVLSSQVLAANDQTLSVGPVQLTLYGPSVVGIQQGSNLLLVCRPPADPNFCEMPPTSVPTALAVPPRRF